MGCHGKLPAKPRVRPLLILPKLRAKDCRQNRFCVKGQIKYSTFRSRDGAIGARDVGPSDYYPFIIH